MVPLPVGDMDVGASITECIIIGNEFAALNVQPIFALLHYDPTVVAAGVSGFDPSVNRATRHVPYHRRGINKRCHVGGHRASEGHRVATSGQICKIDCDCVECVDAGGCHRTHNDAIQQNLNRVDVSCPASFRPKLQYVVPSLSEIHSAGNRAARSLKECHM